MYAEKLLELANKCKDNEIAKKMLEDNLNQCFEYHNIVAMSAIEMQFGNGGISELERLNEKRNRAHDKLCTALNDINSLAQSKGMGKDKIFDFELEEPNKDGRYSQNNHYLTAGMSAIVIDELQYLGKQVYREIDKIEKLEAEMEQEAERRPFKNLSLESMINKMENYNKSHYDFARLLEEYPDKGITLNARDGKGDIVIAAQDEFSVEIIDSNLTPSDELFEYLDPDGTGLDVPISAVKEYIASHEGFNVGRIVELEQEKELSDVIKENEPDKDINKEFTQELDKDDYFTL